MASKYPQKRFQYILDSKKLNDILGVLRDYNFDVSKWFDLGLELGLSYQTLKKVEADNKNNAARCLMECLSKWLEKADKSIVPHTWETLAFAFREINDIAVAEKIQKLADPACQLLQYYCDKLSEVRLSSESVHWLHTEGVISEGILADMEKYGLKGGSMRAVLMTVAEDHNKLRKLATVLSRFDETQCLAKDMLSKYDQAFPSSAPDHEVRVPKKDMVVTPIATTHTDGTESTQLVEVNLYRIDQMEFDRIKNARGILLHNISPFVKDAIPSVEDLKIFLGRCRPELKPQLTSAEKFDDVMNVIDEKCSVVNITLLEAIVEQYKIKADKLIETYENELDEFCREPLRIFENQQLKVLSSSHLHCETIKFTLNWTIDERTFNDIQDLLSKAFRKLARRVEVVVIKKGSITIICYAPHYLMESLLLVAKENLDELKKMGLKNLTIGYYTVYDQREELRFQKEMMSLKDQLAQSRSENDISEKKHKLSVQEKDNEIQHMKLSLEEKEKDIEELREKLNSREKQTQAKTQEIDQLKISLKTKSSSCTQEQELTRMSLLSAQLREKEEKNQLLLEESQNLHSQLLELKARAQLGDDKEKPLTFITEKKQSLYLSEEQCLPALPAEDKLTMMESFQLFEFVMEREKELGLPAIDDILKKPLHTTMEITTEFVKCIQEDPSLLAKLRKTMKEYQEKRKTGKVQWLSYRVDLTSPSPLQCREVISGLKECHRNIVVYNSSSDIIQLLLSDVLRRNTVQTLGIYNTPLTHQLILSLSNLLLINNSLKTLELVDCSITDSGVESLTTVLQYNSTLAELWLKDNPHITSCSTRSISNLLETNSTLTGLWLRGTPALTADGVQALMNSLSANQTLKGLWLDKRLKSTCSQHPKYRLVKDRLSFL